MTPPAGELTARSGRAVGDVRADGVHRVGAVGIQREHLQHVAEVAVVPP
jgi:hypothetical protein